MKFINYVLLAVSAYLALISPVSAQDVAANTIEAINVAKQGDDIAVKIDLKLALTAPPAGFSVANPAKIALDRVRRGRAVHHLDAAQGDGLLARAGHRQRQTADDAVQLDDVLNMEVGNRLRVDDVHGLRDLLNRLRDLVRGNDDLVELL